MVALFSGEVTLGEAVDPGPGCCQIAGGPINVRTKLRHRLEYAAYLGFKGAIRLFPHPWARPLGAALGVLLHALAPAHRRIVKNNLTLVFPDWDGARRRRHEVEVAAERLA